MTKAAVPTKVTMIPTESHKTSRFRVGLESSVRSTCLALTGVDDFVGSGFPPGPVAWVVGRRAGSLDAVTMLWTVNATRKTVSRTIGEEKRM